MMNIRSGGCGGWSARFKQDHRCSTFGGYDMLWCATVFLGVRSCDRGIVIVRAARSDTVGTYQICRGIYIRSLSQITWRRFRDVAATLLAILSRLEGWLTVTLPIPWFRSPLGHDLCPFFRLAPLFEPAPTAWSVLSAEGLSWRWGATLARKRRRLCSKLLVFQDLDCCRVIYSLTRTSFGMIAVISYKTHEGLTGTDPIRSWG